MKELVVKFKKVFMLLVLAVSIPTYSQEVYKCPNCYGYGRFSNGMICRVCKGYGTVLPCHQCGGYGGFPNGVRCRVCKGYGIVGVNMRRGPEGKLECPRCHGTGTYTRMPRATGGVVAYNDCINCGATYQIGSLHSCECRKCGGTGYK